MKTLQICLCALLLLCVLSLPCMAADDNLGEEDFFETTEDENMGEIEVFDTTQSEQQPPASQTQQTEVTTEQGTEHVTEQTPGKVTEQTESTASDKNHGGMYWPESEMEWELPPIFIVLAILVIAIFGTLVCVILLIDYFKNGK